MASVTKATNRNQKGALEDWCWNLNIPPSEKIVLMCLVYHSWPDDQGNMQPVYPSQTRIGEMAHLGRQAVNANIGRLAEKGLIRVEEEGRFRRYHFNYQPVAKDDRSDDNLSRKATSTCRDMRQDPVAKGDTKLLKGNCKEETANNIMLFFEEFWIASGRRGSKKDAAFWWKKRVKDGADPNHLLSRMKAYAKCTEWEFRVHTFRWLKKNYDDQLYKGENVDTPSLIDRMIAEAQAKEASQ